jgi:hypothetical protein
VSFVSCFAKEARVLVTDAKLCQEPYTGVTNTDETDR